VAGSRSDVENLRLPGYESPRFPEGNESLVSLREHRLFIAGARRVHDTVVEFDAHRKQVVTQSIFTSMNFDVAAVK
jgi:hypothetical protein